MKHVINTKTRTCTQCNKLLGTIRDAECHGTAAAENEEEDLRNEPRMKRAANTLEDAKQFTDKLKALGEELGFKVVEVNSPEELEESTAIPDIRAIGDLLREAFAESFNKGKAEQPFVLDEGQYDLLKMMVEHPMPTNHIGVLQLPLEHISTLLKTRQCC